VNAGVTVIVPLIGDVPPFVAIKTGTEPEPFAPRPIPVLELVQLYVVVPPVRLVVKFVSVVGVPAQYTWSAGSFTCADGLTVIVNVWAVPEQLTPPLLKVGVTVIVALTGEVPPLVAVNAGNEPVPPAPSPIAVLELLHE
jgi:hypothetical protein